MTLSEKRCGTVALIGAPNAGKSTLLNAVLGQKIAPSSRRPQTTRRQVRGIYTKDNIQMIFVDTPGMLKPGYELQSYMQKQAEQALDGVDVIVWVVDVALAMKRHHQEALETVRRVIQKSKGPKTPVIAVLNKIDTLENKEALLPLLQEWEAKKEFEALIPLSALKNKGVDTFLSLLAKHMPNEEFIFDAELLTDLPERELVSDLIREKAMQRLGDEVPYQVAITIEEFDESRREETAKKPLVSISAVIHVERDSQKAIVIGKQGARLKAIGTAARISLQRLLGCQVMLRLFVRVEPEWSKSTKALRKLGYR